MLRRAFDIIKFTALWRSPNQYDVDEHLLVPGAILFDANPTQFEDRPEELEKSSGSQDREKKNCEKVSADEVRSMPQNVVDQSWSPSFLLMAMPFLGLQTPM